MGSSSSRSGRPSESVSSRTKRRLSSLVCGGSTSHTSVEGEEHVAKSPLSSKENFASVSGESRKSRAESSSVFCLETGLLSSETDVGASSESINGSTENNFVGNALRHVEASSAEKCLFKSKDLVSHQLNANCNCKEAYFEKDGDTASTSYNEQPCPESVSANTRVSVDAGAECENSTNGTVPLIVPEDINSSNMSQERPDGDFVENNGYVAMGLDPSASGSLSVVSDSLLRLQFLGGDAVQGATTAGSGFLVSDSEQDMRRGSVLLVDVVSISSNVLSSRIAEISNREARRNNRRVFWDALSRHSFRGHRDSPTIFFTIGHTDDLGSHDRWLLDLSGDLHYDGVSRNAGYLVTGGPRRNEQGRQSRSEISERAHSVIDDGGQQTGFCVSGLHPDGTCLCESSLRAEDSGMLASISRIVMLAEALVQVLDEIHHQPLSLSLSMLSHPALESVVNSFPLKNYKKSDATKSETPDVQQCNICLAEYDEGDKIRVLPCRHEYHMLCVDKWLKEIHSVCPLCRCNVSEDVSQDTVTNTGISSQ